MLHDQESELPRESTSVYAKNILDVNDDCLREIFSWESFEILDLCSIVETHSRFQQVVGEVFSKRFKNVWVDVGSRKSELNMKTERILRNFGPFISKLSIWNSFSVRRSNFSLLDWVIEFCSNTLESIELSNVTITEDVAMKLAPLFSILQEISLTECKIHSEKELFCNCVSLVGLKMVNVRASNDQPLAFPNLVRFEYGVYGIYVRYIDDNSRLLQILTNCKQLTELFIRFPMYADSKKVLSRISTLVHLKKLKIDYIERTHQNVTKFIQELRSRNTLEFLALSRIQGDSELIPALSEVKSLQGLQLEYCRGLRNLNPLAELGRLTELEIRSDQPVLDVDVVRMIERLINLKMLLFDAFCFKMDQQTFQRIVAVVRGRAGSDALKITCRTANYGSANSFGDENCRKIVKIIEIKKR